MREEWRNVEGFPSYQVSNKGRIRSFHKKGFRTDQERKRGWRILEPHLTNGRPSLNLFDNGKTLYTSIGRLVAQAFIPNPDNLPVVRHLNDHPYDNYVSNLAWGTYGDNTQDAIHNNVFKTEKALKPVLATNIETGEEIFLESRTACAEFLGVGKATISEYMQKDNPVLRGYRLEPSHFERWWSK